MTGLTVWFLIMVLLFVWNATHPADHSHSDKIIAASQSAYRYTKDA